MRYVAVSPIEALDRVKKKLEEDVREMEARIDSLKDSEIMTELNELFNKGLKIVAPGEMTGALKGSYSMTQQMTSMFKDASKSINIITSHSGVEELLSNHFDALRKAKERGVTIRIATHSTGKKSDKLKNLRNVAEVRYINKKDLPVKGKFFLIDGREMMLPLTDSTSVHATQNMALWSRSEYVTNHMLSPLFDMVWSNSKPSK
jgi:sugar-specific transcriptional regulator TrmB